MVYACSNVVQSGLVALIACLVFPTSQFKFINSVLFAVVVRLHCKGILLPRF